VRSVPGTRTLVVVVAVKCFAMTVLEALELQSEET
jgi:hypothetical protein